jgi:hypothetical protein
MYWVVLRDMNDVDPQGFYRRIEIVAGPLLTQADADLARRQAEATLAQDAHLRGLHYAILTDAQVKQAKQNGTFILDLRL